MRSILVGVCVLLVCVDGVRSTQPEEVRRLRGIIDKDETWSGTILITDNLNIVGAKVRVNPGTVIEFSGGNPNRRPILTVGAEPSPTNLESGGGNSGMAAGRLEMEGTADRPIVVRTAAGSGSGRIIVIVRNILMPARLEAGKIVQSAPATPEPDRLDWKYVRFERLGNMERRREMSRDVDFWQPSVQILIRKGGQQVVLENCEFRDSAHLLVQPDDGCEALIRACSFDKAADPSSVKIQALDETIAARSIDFVENFAAGMITLGAGPCQAAQNRLIGPSAGIAVRPDSTGDISVVSNYVHCTDDSDKGRYVLTVERPDAIVRDNVLIGGAYVVHQGAFQMSGNVLVAAPRLTTGKGGKARTHRLVASLPPGAVFEKNILIGPALALVGPQRVRRRESGSHGDTASPPPVIIRQNVLDGLDNQSRVLQLSLPRQVGGSVELFDNLVLRSGAMVADSNSKSDGLVFADYNAIIGGPDTLFQRATVAGLNAGEEGWSKHDQRFDSAGAARLVAVPDAPFDFDEAILSGTMTVGDARRRFFDSYRMREDSPLIGAGRPVNGRRGDIGISSK